MAARSLSGAFGLYTDLALEARDLVRGATEKEIPGVTEEKWDFPHGTVRRIRILNEQAERVMAKPRGTYLTIEAPSLRYKAPEVQRSVAAVLARHLQEALAGLSPEAPVLVIGLGNWQATPDALGPTVVRFTLVTRHLRTHAPDLAAGFRPVSAFAPGVLGTTGIETAEMIRGVVERVRPSAVIAVDALAAASVSRLGTTVQVADTGISPGSGVNNKRVEVSARTIGCPVIAVGVPTVVSAAAIAAAALEAYHKKIAGGDPVANPFFVEEVLGELFRPFGGELVVTPREIDELILNAGRALARGITIGLNPQVAEEDLEVLLC